MTGNFMYKVHLCSIFLLVKTTAIHNIRYIFKTRT